MRLYRRTLIISLLVALLTATWTGCAMPGKSFSGPLPPMTSVQSELAQSLEQDVTVLAKDIGFRDMAHPDQLAHAAKWISDQFAQAGLIPARHEYTLDGQTVANIVAEIPGKSAEIIVVGAHYDSAHGTPGANDNASGIAGTLALARHFARQPQPKRTLRFVAFVNEEPPVFQTDNMGSLVYARACKERREKIVAMLSLETIGYYTDAPDSQKYPFPFSMVYPSTGNFIAFVGNTGSSDLVHRAIGTFRETAQFPSEGGAVPGWIPGIGWSDQWSFWQCGYPAIMLTDTATFRYPYYHHPHDTPDKLDYPRMARVVDGLKAVVEDLANGR